jgi:alkanesulfonate monooxygenase SsuD/methylene tetrahydromethanopterin reductase-like flavin-dependent oxidoreductase (luciferase family)
MTTNGDDDKMFIEDAARSAMTRIPPYQKQSVPRIVGAPQSHQTRATIAAQIIVVSNLDT